MPRFVANAKDKCPHCRTVVKFLSPEEGHWQGREGLSATGEGEYLSFYVAQCPQCGRLVVTIHATIGSADESKHDEEERVVWPLSSGRAPAPPEVPDGIAADYWEASLVLPLSEKASAALSRRCLLAVLTDAGKTKGENLFRQIDQVVPKLPTEIAANLDAVREIGNFAAHPRKSETSGEVLHVEAGEAEWNLDVLESLFDYYYVRPEVERKKREALNAKLQEAGKPPLREPRVEE